MRTSSASPPRPQRQWAYFIDLDGTLIELAATPDAAFVGVATFHLLQSIATACGALALVSGRRLSDLDRRMRGLILPAAGQHGLERRDANGHTYHYPGDALALDRLRQQLLLLAEQQPQLLLEDKGQSLALHYRQAPQLASSLTGLLHRLVVDVGAGLALQEGKSVLEVKPAGMDKGKAIAAFMAEPPFLGRRPVFIGDDVTDEDGFECVRSMSGLAIKVGDGPSAADYRLRDVTAVQTWLRGLVENDDENA